MDKNESIAQQLFCGYLGNKLHTCPKTTPSIISLKKKLIKSKACFRSILNKEKTTILTTS